MKYRNQMGNKNTDQEKSLLIDMLDLQTCLPLQIYFYL